MRDVLSYFLIANTNKKQVYFIFGLITILYLINFSTNDIFTPNESFYAESVREMFESGDFLDIKYNYESRYNKPPLTYWSIAASVAIFGINEFGIRLPIVLMALGSIWLTYLLGRKLYGERAGIYAMMIMAVSVQLIFVKQYASPEVPLTFFFTLTMYWFLKGYLDHSKKHILLAYLALGLTVLTKGFPYIIVIGGIIFLFILIDSEFKIKEFWAQIKRLQLHIGLPIVVLVGLSWVIYMYLKDGNDFWLVYKRETFDRALSKSNKGPEPFFYLAVIAWSIAPYSLAFYYALIRNLKNWQAIKKHSFALSWIVVMLVIFTMAKGKLPTYMIQAHPGLILLMLPMILNFRPDRKAWRYLWDFSLVLPAILILGVSIFMIFALSMSPFILIFPLLIIGLIVAIFYQCPKEATVIVPFWAMVSFLLVFSFYLPKMEAFRPYDEIGEIVLESDNIASSTPLLLDGWLIHNLPFYTARKAIRDATLEDINLNKGQTLAFIRDENKHQLKGFETLWSGEIYDFPSESQFFKFVMAINQASKGDLEKFHKFHLVFRP